VDKSCASSALVFWCGSFAMRKPPNGHASYS
jgi:hypothetical protein